MMIPITITRLINMKQINSRYRKLEAHIIWEKHRLAGVPFSKMTPIVRPYNSNKSTYFFGFQSSAAAHKIINKASGNIQT